MINGVPVHPIAVIGCDVPATAIALNANAAGGYFQTCGDGSIEFSFTTLGTWAFDDQSSIQFAYAAAGMSERGCISATNSSAALGFGCLPTTAAPEPATLTLMATGLFSVAGFARTRRRAKARQGLS